MFGKKKVVIEVGYKGGSKEGYKFIEIYVKDAESQRQIKRKVVKNPFVILEKTKQDIRKFINHYQPIEIVDKQGTLQRLLY